MDGTTDSRGLPCPKNFLTDRPLPQDIWPRILPFSLFMAFIGVEEVARTLNAHHLSTISEQALYGLYPLKTLAVGALLLLYRKRYPEIQFTDWRHLKTTALSVSTGLLIFVLWINLDWAFGVQGEPAGFNPAAISDTGSRELLLSFRLAGAVLVVPVMEELFWRSFLLRYIIKSQFTRVPLGTFTWPSFVLTSILFGVEHHYILAGIVAGILFNLLLYRTRSLSQCILAHAVANLALGLYVLQSGQWRFW